MSEYKSCCRCKSILSLTSFNKDKQNKDGLQRRCRLCNREVNQLDYQKHQQSRLQKDAKYRAENPEKTKKAIKKWATNNKEKLAQSSREWFKKHPEYSAHLRHNRRAMKLQNGVYKITSIEYKKLYAKECIYCGAKGKIHLDHVIPISRGGTHSIGNLVPACASCNTSKGKKFITEWLHRHKGKP